MPRQGMLPLRVEILPKAADLKVADTVDNGRTRCVGMASGCTLKQVRLCLHSSKNDGITQESRVPVTMAASPHSSPGCHSL